MVAQFNPTQFKAEIQKIVEIFKTLLAQKKLGFENLGFLDNIAKETPGPNNSPVLSLICKILKLTNNNTLLWEDKFSRIRELLYTNLERDGLLIHILIDALFPKPQSDLLHLAEYYSDKEELVLKLLFESIVRYVSPDLEPNARNIPPRLFPQALAHLESSRAAEEVLADLATTREELFVKYLINNLNLPNGSYLSPNAQSPLMPIAKQLVAILHLNQANWTDKLSAISQFLYSGDDFVIHQIIRTLMPQPSIGPTADSSVFYNQYEGNVREALFQALADYVLTQNVDIQTASRAALQSLKDKDQQIYAKAISSDELKILCKSTSAIIKSIDLEISIIDQQKKSIESRYDLKIQVLEDKNRALEEHRKNLEIAHDQEKQSKTRLIDKSIKELFGEVLSLKNEITTLNNADNYVLLQNYRDTLLNIVGRITALLYEDILRNSSSDYLSLKNELKDCLEKIEKLLSYEALPQFIELKNKIEKNISSAIEYPELFTKELGELMSSYNAMTEMIELRLEDFDDFFNPDSNRKLEELTADKTQKIRELEQSKENIAAELEATKEILSREASGTIEINDCKISVLNRGKNMELAHVDKTREQLEQAETKIAEASGSLMSAVQSGRRLSKTELGALVTDRAIPIYQNYRHYKSSPENPSFAGNLMKYFTQFLNAIKRLAGINEVNSAANDKAEEASANVSISTSAPVMTCREEVKVKAEQAATALEGLERIYCPPPASSAPGAVI